MSRFPARAVPTTLAAGIGLIAVLAAGQPLGAREADPLLRSTPLVLKDGRIASVSVHVVPFAPGRAELGGEAKERVAELTRAAATDCFLTAQVIGHIDGSEIARDDTLDAHRLARSRADAVQASLIDGGLPAKSIASVWDWQFMVRAPRVTLWIFQLTAGEDCEGTPLPGALVAQRVPSTRQSPAPPQRAAAPAERATSMAAKVAEPAQAPAAPASKALQTPAEAARSTASQPATPAERASPTTPAGQQGPDTAVATRPALAPKAQASDGNAGQQPEQRESTTALAAAQASTTTRAAAREDQAPAARQAAARAAKDAQPAKQAETRTAAATPATSASASDGKVEPGPGGGLVITFATNSSYFPSGTTRRLRQLIAGLAPEGKYEVSLQVAVSGSTKVVGARSPEEAARYNQWLAERRLERVQNWLLEHGGAAALTFKPEYVTDESRQVVVRLSPVS